MPGRKATLKVNRAPVLTLWAAVVAERLGHGREAALTLGKAVAGLNAVSKGRRLGIYEKPEADETRAEPKPKKPKVVELLGRRVPIQRTRAGIRALSGDTPEKPAAVARYLESKFGDALDEVRAAMTELAASFEPDELEKKAYSLYEKFRPSVPSGEKGWGAAGELELAAIAALRRRRR
jgi:hypothetical protein